jgi:hypothetical protein
MNIETLIAAMPSALGLPAVVYAVVFIDDEIPNDWSRAIGVYLSQEEAREAVEKHAAALIEHDGNDGWQLRRISGGTPLDVAAVEAIHCELADMRKEFAETGEFRDAKRFDALSQSLMTNEVDELGELFHILDAASDVLGSYRISVVALEPSSEEGAS